MNALTGSHPKSDARRDARWGEFPGSTGKEGTGTSLWIEAEQERVTEGQRVPV
jgi:hypothetical protein